MDSRPIVVDSAVDLEAQAARRARALTSVLALSQEIVAQLDLDRLLEAVVGRARDLTRARVAALCLLDPDGALLRLAATTDDSDAPRPLEPYEATQPAGRVVGSGETVVVDAACARCGFQAAHAPGLCAAAPLRTGETTLGALCVIRDRGQPFEPEETQALTLLANFAAIAITNARLAEAGRAQAKQAAALAERERLAAELHDDLAQTLGFLGLKVERALDDLALGRAENARRELAAMGPALETAYGQVRAALSGLSQPVLDEVDLIDRLGDCLREFGGGSNVPAELVVIDPSAAALPRLAKVQAVAIVREALANARRHAAARRVRVIVERQDGMAQITVDDDGRGFDPRAAAGEVHFGLAIMRARAERLGGRLVVDSSPGLGTRVTAAFPLVEAGRA